MGDFCIGVFGLFLMFNVIIKLLNFLIQAVGFRAHQFFMLDCMPQVYPQNRNMSQ